MQTHRQAFASLPALTRRCGPAATSVESKQQAAATVEQQQRKPACLFAPRVSWQLLVDANQFSPSAPVRPCTAVSWSRSGASRCDRTWSPVRARGQASSTLSVARIVRIRTGWLENVEPWLECGRLQTKEQAEYTHFLRPRASWPSCEWLLRLPACAAIVAGDDRDGDQTSSAAGPARRHRGT